MQDEAAMTPTPLPPERIAEIAAGLGSCERDHIMKEQEA